MLKKIYLTTLVVLIGIAVHAVVVEQAWYDDVKTITPGEQYYIYSVNVERFMVPGEDTLLIARRDLAATPFTISSNSDGYTYSGDYYLCAKGSKTSGPIGAQDTEGNKLTWTWLPESGAWNIHSKYIVNTMRYYAALYYTDQYLATSSLGVKNFYKTSPYLWWLISTAQYDRHWAIYDFDSYKDTTNITVFQGKVETTVYTQLQLAYSKTFNVQDEKLSAAEVESALKDLQDKVAYAEQYPNLYERSVYLIDSLRTVAQGISYTEIPNALFDLLHTFDDFTCTLVGTPMAEIKSVLSFLKDKVETAEKVKPEYSAGLAAIQALEDYPDKGDGNLIQIEDDIEAARIAIEQATTVEAVKKAATLRKIDPITFESQLFALNSDLSNIASAESGLPVSYVSDNHDVVDEHMKAVAVGGATIIASTQGNDSYYPFVREKQIFIVENIPSGIAHNEGETECTKILLDGQLYIRRGGELYDMLGRKSN